MDGRLVAPDLVHRMDAHREALTARMHGALQEHAFSNRALFPPRRLAEIAQEQATAFLAFLDTGDEEAIRQEGRKLAHDGLGIRSILALTEALRQAGWSSVNPEGTEWPPLQQALGRYTTALLEGYITKREESVLEQQERTREALLRALQKS